MDDHGDGVKVRTRLELEPNVSVMKMCKEQDNALAQLCSATQLVKCAVAYLSPSSLASVSLSFLSQFSTLSS